MEYDLVSRSSAEIMCTACKGWMGGYLSVCQRPSQRMSAHKEVGKTCRPE